MYDIPAAIKALSDSISKAFDFAKTSKEHQAETEILKENKGYERALDCAEAINDLIEKNNGFLNEDNLKQFYKLKRNFDKNKR